MPMAHVRQTCLPHIDQHCTRRHGGTIRNRVEIESVCGQSLVIEPVPMAESFHPFRLLIVEDHAMVAQGLIALLEVERDIEIVGTASTAASAFEMVERLRPDVVLMDFRLPDGDGATATQRIKEAFPSTQVVILTGEGDDATLGRAIEAGSSGFLSKVGPIEDTIRAIRAVARGEVVISPNQVITLLDRMNRRREPKHDLSQRELQVLRLVATGTATDEISEQLFISTHTVRNHVRNILAKLNAHSKLEAVAIATRDGLITLDASG
jgi:DNA-binding NarL/FixJ family response regulator